MASEPPPRISMPGPEAPYKAVEAYAQRTRASLVLALLVIVGVTGALHWPVFEGVATGTERWFEWDVPEQYWPDLVYFCGALHDGDVPYWNPYDRGGYPFYADPQAGSFHPINWTICALAGRSPGLGWATARVVLGFLLAGLFGLLWLRRIGASWSGAIVGATVIEAAPFMRHSWELNLSSGFAYAPLVLWAADRLAVQRQVADGLLFALALGLCGWVGSPPALWLTGTLACLYLAFRIGEEWRVHGRAIARGAPALASGLLLAAGLLGVILLPGAHLAAHSVQAGRDFASIAEGALEPAQLLALVWPQPGNHLFVGWLALSLAPLGLSRGRDRQAWFFLVVAILAVAMTTGGPVFRAAFELVPGVRHFRAPARYEAWLGIAAGALAAFGMTALAQAVPTRRRIEQGAAALALALGGVALVTLDGATPGWMAIALGVILLARTMPRPFGVGAAPWGALLAALVLADVTAAMPPERHMREGPPPGADAAPVFAEAPGTRVHHRLMDEFAVGCRSGARTRRRDLRGYQDPLLLASYERVIGSVRAYPGLAAQMGVRYALQGPHFIHGWDRHYLPPPEALRAQTRSRVLWEDGERSVTELLDALPFAYFVPAEEVERAPDRAAALARVRELAPSAVAILEGPADRGAGDVEAGPIGAGAGRRPLARARSARLDADALAFDLDAPTDGVVVIGEAFYPGWRAKVDDEPTPIVRANGFVRAVRVDAGRHRIQMRFRPDDGVYWRQVYILSLLGVLAGLGAGPLRRVLRRWAKR